MAELLTARSHSAKRRLALFLDGTWDRQDGNTNVWRAKCLCAPVGADGLEQKIFYSIGVGTNVGSKLAGGAFGKGIDDVIIAAYEWLVETYQDGDEVFIFGFSRGAYTARSLSGFISRVGLIRLGAPLGIKQLYDRYKKGNVAKTIHQLLEADGKESALPLEEKWMRKFCAPINVKFTGVWDTVGAFADTNFAGNLTGGTHSYLDANLRKTETYVYHAVAIDEQRKVFDTTLLTQYVPKDQPGPFHSPRSLSDVEQRWFVGAHGDVGGGSYNDLLAQIPLRWLLTKASAHGLTFRTDYEVDLAVSSAPVEDSFSDFLYGFYKLVKLGKRNYRPIARPPEERKITVVHTINETIDSSVFERWRADRTYRPPNLADWASRYGVKPEDLTTSVLANDPTLKAPD